MKFSDSPNKLQYCQELTAFLFLIQIEYLALKSLQNLHSEVNKLSPFSSNNKFGARLKRDISRNRILSKNFTLEIELVK
jgi:hypothetical protein